MRIEDFEVGMKVKFNDIYGIVGNIGVDYVAVDFDTIICINGRFDSRHYFMDNHMSNSIHNLPIICGLL